MRRRSWREGRARQKPVPVWRRSLLVYTIGSSLVTLASGAAIALVQPIWLAVVLWLGGLFVFGIAAAGVETFLLNRRVLRYLAEGRTSAACAAIATSMLLTDSEKQERIRKLKDRPDDILPTYDAKQVTVVPWLGLLALVGVATWRGIAGDPVLEVINLALLASFGFAILDGVIHRTMGRARVRVMLDAGRVEEATRLAHRYEVAALKTFAFGEVFEAHGHPRYREVIDGLPGAPWVATACFAIAAVSRLVGLPAWLALAWVVLSVLGTGAIMMNTTRARIWLRLDELAEQRRFDEADALAERVEATHGISFEEE